MKPYEIWLQPDKFEVVAFYPYTSNVICTFLEQSCSYKTPEHEFLEEFGEKIKEMAIAKGAKWDNKVVVEIKYKLNDVATEFVINNLFVGFKDGVIKAGLGVHMYEEHFSIYQIIKF